MTKLGVSEIFLALAVPALGLLLFVALVALGTLVARRVWRWDERRDARRGGR